jgi:hypothetical protein
MKKFIAFIGFKRSGKDTTKAMVKTISRAIKDTETFHDMIMADDFKSATIQTFGFSRKMIEGIGYDREQVLPEPVILTEVDVRDFIDEFFGDSSVGLRFKKSQRAEVAKSVIGKELVSVRKLLQFIGTEVLHQFGGDVHVEMQCNKPVWQNDMVLCSDIRFPIEFDVCEKYSKEKGYDFESIYVDNPEITTESLGQIEAGTAHDSEKFIPELGKRCDYHLVNRKKEGGYGLVDLTKDSIDIVHSMFANNKNQQRKESSEFQN